ncbi:cyclic peptide transporter, partial [Candidatus Magnetomorum sp. HK-1]
MNFFIILAKENLPKFLVIILLSIVSGIFSGLIIIFALNGIEDIVVGQNYSMYVLLIPITAIIIFISTRFAQLESAFLSENIQEKLILKISNNFRRAKLETIERKNLTDIYRQILNAQTITNSITKYINMFQSIITIFILWVYIYIISVIMGLILLIFFFFVILVYELYQKLLEPIIVEQLTHETEMYSQISSILNGLKELKLDPSKNDDLFNNYLKNEIIETKNLKSSMLFSHVQYYLFINTGFFVMLGITGFILTSFFHPSIIMKVLTIIIFIWTPTLTIVDA